MTKRSRCPARNQRVACSIPGGDIYFHFEFFACFPSLQVGETLANEIKHDHSPVVIVVSRAFMVGAASQAGDADSSRSPGLNSGLQGSLNIRRGVLLLVPQ